MNCEIEMMNISKNDIHDNYSSKMWKTNENWEDEYIKAYHF
jgi:hypothetical protein